MARLGHDLNRRLQVAPRAGQQPVVEAIGAGEVLQRPELMRHAIGRAEFVEQDDVAGTQIGGKRRQHVERRAIAVSYTNLTLPTSDLV